MRGGFAETVMPAVRGFKNIIGKTESIFLKCEGFAITQTLKEKQRRRTRSTCAQCVVILSVLGN